MLTLDRMRPAFAGSDSFRSTGVRVSLLVIS